MESGSESSRKTKRKFAPRAPPPSRRPTGTPPTIEADGDEQAARTIASNYAIGRVKPKAEKKVSAKVAFQPTSASLPIAPVAVPKDDGKSGDSDPKGPSSVDVLATVSSANAQKDREETCTVDDHVLVPEAENHYVEPWDHNNPYSPITLPLRKPPAGDPELRNKEEFGEVPGYAVYDENTINSAEELGLTPEERGKQKLLFFQLPGHFPVKKQSTDATSEDNSQRCNTFEGLQRGFMGKMVVYKSGAVKLKLGDILYDVSPGLRSNFANTVAAFDMKKKHCCDLGSTEKTVTVTPDVNDLLKAKADMETKI